jgi:predicted MFS family arabinose efflux permease
MVHRHVDADHRTTVVSANSLASQAGGAASGIVLGVVADATSISAAMIVAGVILLGAAPLYLVRPSRPPAEIRSVEHVRREDASAVGGRQR